MEWKYKIYKTKLISIKELYNKKIKKYHKRDKESKIYKDKIVKLNKRMINWHKE